MDRWKLYPARRWRHMLQATARVRHPQWKTFICKSACFQLESNNWINLIFLVTNCVTEGIGNNPLTGTNAQAGLPLSTRSKAFRPMSGVCLMPHIMGNGADFMYKIRASE